jgi:pentapeptide MXKDX repeat protein
VNSAHDAANTQTGRTIMKIRPLAAAVGAILFGLCLSTGGANAQTSTDSMKKPDSMKSDTMKTDPMKTDSMKMGSSKMSGTKADCMHKAGMEKNNMKKSEMMKHCDAMK